MNIGIIGGDSRTVHLTKMLVADGYEVSLIGLENCEELKRI